MFSVARAITEGFDKNQALGGLDAQRGDLFDKGKLPMNVPPHTNCWGPSEQFPEVTPEQRSKIFDSLGDRDAGKLNFAEMIRNPAEAVKQMAERFDGQDQGLSQSGRSQKPTLQEMLTNPAEAVKKMAPMLGDLKSAGPGGLAESAQRAGEQALDASQGFQR